MSQEEVVAAVKAEVKKSKYEALVSKASLPADLSGALAEAAALPPPPAFLTQPIDEHFAIGNIIVKNKEQWKGLSTSGEFLGDVTKELRNANSWREVEEAKLKAFQRLRDTGAYKGIEISGGTPGARDVQVELTERGSQATVASYVTSKGRLDMMGQYSVMNVFGGAETITLGTHRETNFENLSTLLAGTAIGGRSVGSQIKKEDGSLLSRSIQLPDVPFYIRYSQPSLQGRFTPVSVQVGRDLDSYELSSSFVNRVTQAEASVQDETGRHRLAYSLAWRNPFVTRSTTDVFATTASPQVVEASIPSLKSSLSYSFSMDKSRRLIADSGAVLGGMTGGHKLALSAELAGLGGDVRFLKTNVDIAAARSFGRRMPDTGYERPPTRTEWADNASFAWSSYRKDSRTRELLRPSPVVTQNAGKEFAWKQRVQGWLASGVTASVEAAVGCLLPLPGLYPSQKHFPAGSLSQQEGQGKGQQQGGAAAVAPLVTPLQPSSNLVDRFFLAEERLRGYHTVGPRGAAVAGGLAGGDALGGDVLCAVSARLLLPPPIPSVRLTNAGVRTQLIASAGRVGATVGSLTSDPLSFFKQASLAAGVGVVIPLSEGMEASIELNYFPAAWSRRGQAAGSSDEPVVGLKFKLGQ